MCEIISHFKRCPNLPAEGTVNQPSQQYFWSKNSLESIRIRSFLYRTLLEEQVLVNLLYFSAHVHILYTTAPYSCFMSLYSMNVVTTVGKMTFKADMITGTITWPMYSAAVSGHRCIIFFTTVSSLSLVCDTTRDNGGGSNGVAYVEF
jgi:hypothetical protein